MGKVLTAAYILIPLLAFLTYYRLDSAGLLRPEIRSLYNPIYERCWKMDIHGPDDLALCLKERITFVSVLDKRKYFIEGVEDPEAGIYCFNLSLEATLPMKKLALVNYPANRKLHPHGISYFETKRGEQFLFVIDHQLDGEYVQVFEWKKGQLYWKWNITNSLFVSLNNIVGLSNMTFYVTNGHGNRGPGAILEDVLGLCRGSILYFDGKKVTTAVSDLCVPNGIDVSPDLGVVYVAETQTGNLNLFRRDKKTSSLTEMKRIPLNLAIDNVNVQKNQVIIGAHRNVVDFYRYVFFNSRCSSAVVRVSFDDEYDPTIERIYGDSGFVLQSASGAIIAGGRMIIGTAFDDLLMICDNPEVIPQKKLSAKEIASFEKELQKAEDKAKREAANE